MKKLLLLPAICMAALSLAGCAAVGPNFRKPETATPAAWRNTPAADNVPAADNGATLARWWKTMGDPALDRLVERAVDNNLSLRAALSKIREARALRASAGAAQSPSASATDSAIRKWTEQRHGGSSAGASIGGALDASWELDLFGGTRRAVEAADADLAATFEKLRDVRVSLLAEVAGTYIQLRVDQARLSSAESTLRLLAETEGIVKARVAAGLDGDLALRQAETNLESGNALLPALRASIEAGMNALAVLTGENPGTLHGMLSDSGPIPSATLSASAGLPAELLRRRPDIRKAEAELAAAVARVGVATAALYPRFSLGGSISVSGASLLVPSTAASSLGPSVSWSLLDGGAARSNIAVQDERAEQALTAWRATVLAALKETEDAMKAYSEEKARHEALSRAAEAAGKAASLARTRYTAGMTGFTTVLDAERSLLSLRDQLVQSDGAVSTGLVRIYKALGGGWVPRATTRTDVEAN